MSTYGKIKIFEQLYCSKEQGKQCKRLSQSLKMKCRGYSSLLQRAIVDFSSDESFQKASSKIKEHYGVEIPAVSAQRITYFHAHQMKTTISKKKQMPEKGVDVVICESDGTMIPLVGIKKGRGDCRKRRNVFWKEGISTLSYAQGSETASYGASLEGGREVAGVDMLHTAICAGVGKNSDVHVVGDGAKWIAEHTEKIFGTPGRYLIDFYHLCDYIANAIDSAPIKNAPSYLGRVKSGSPPEGSGA